jgi:hypothetical protein
MNNDLMLFIVDFDSNMFSFDNMVGSLKIVWFRGQNACF